MKQLTLALLVLLLSTLAGCSAEKDPGSTWDRETVHSSDTTAEESPGSTWDRETVYSSDTSAEDCYLCSGTIENLVPSYWGQNNVALISLNTFEIVPLEINRYDKIDGHLIEEYAGEVSSGEGGGTDGGFFASLLLDHDRGLAGGSIYFQNDEVLDIGKAASFLCADCLNGMIQSTYGPYFGVGVIDLETKEINVLEKRLAGFGLGDYYIFCSLQEQEENDPLEMKLLIIYCPIRYAPLT